MCICSYVFKLADFGTARELAPGETFFSLHGTEEYLYPGMYERALVNPQKKKDFSAKVCCSLIIFTRRSSSQFSNLEIALRILEIVCQS